MATSSKNIKGFFRQKKNSTAGGISKSKSSSKPSSKMIHAAASASDVTLHPPALISHGGDRQDDDEKEKVLKQFDLNMAYGPCLGMTRLGRWERAQRLGLNPPKQIEGLLLSQANAGKVESSECLWAGRV